MSRYRGTIRPGNGKPVQRQGHSLLGLDTHNAGAVSGIEVQARAEGSADVFEVYATGGSSGRIADTLVGTLRDNPDTGRPRFEIFDGSAVDL